MQSQLHAEELSIIEAAAADSESDKFEILMTLLELPEAYRACLDATLREGQWRRSEEPKSAIKKAVLSAGLGRMVHEKRAPGFVSGLSEAAITLAHIKHSEPDAIKGADGVWRTGHDLGMYDSNDRESTTHICSRLQEQRGRSIDWKLISASLEKAGLDEMEMAFIMGYLGKKRARAEFVKSVVADEGDRKAALAAVKRVQRKMPRIRRIIGGE